jgi:Flp pilus assembly protein TadD
VTSIGVSSEKVIETSAATGLFASISRQKLLLSILLIAATVALYYPVEGHPFVNYDDNVYVVENTHVTAGLHWPTVKWAFTQFEQGNWHPLTWLSHAADCQWFGLNPAGHHETNVVLHALNVVLLFWVLQKATGYMGRSAMVAALFALHPINVESVAWISERKNLLSMTFFLLALGAYRVYVLKPRFNHYAVVAFLYALGLMSKPQVITFPCVLLLWDYWPLQRMVATSEKSSMTEAGEMVQGRTFSWLVWEKVPLFALSAVSAIITVKAQKAGYAMQYFPRSVRLENAVVAYASYVKKAFWPFDLSPMYPHPGASITKWQVLVAFVFVLLITAVVVNHPRRRYLAMGWLWFLGTLVPMIGLVQVGNQAMADRYAYLSFLGLFIMICWGVGDWAQQRHVAAAWLKGASIVVLLALALVARNQIGYWSDNITLWTHALAVTKDNWLAEDNLGGALMDDGKLEKAIDHFRAAAAIYPEGPVSHLDIGFYEQEHKNWPQAIQEYYEVLKETPSPKLRSEAYNNLALINRDIGDFAAARNNFQQAVNISPGYVGAWVGLGLAAQKTGDLNLAAQAYSRAVQIQPSGSGYLLLAQALEKSGRRDEALAASQHAKQVSENLAADQRTTAKLLAQ